MSSVFLDTVGLLAVWDRTDQWNAAASAVYGRLFVQHRQLVTTPFVLLKCGNAAARRPYRRRVHALWNAFEQEQALIEPTTADFATAWAAYDRGEAAEAGIVDHLSFAVMRRSGITEAFTNDKHFVAAGFEVLF
jgi:predicted nucleic acid-binding protein